MVQRNKEFKDYMKSKKVFNWQLAEHLGVAESTIYRWLRVEMDKDEKAKMLKVVDAIAKENES